MLKVDTQETCFFTSFLLDKANGAHVRTTLDMVLSVAQLNILLTFKNFPQ